MTHSTPDAFSRQRGLPGLGDAGQRALGGARVAVVGAGGLGCPAAQYLAAAGVGHLTLIDADTVSVTNLHRQILFGPEDVGCRKVDAAARALRRLAPGVDIVPVPRRIDAADAADVFDGHDVVVDGTDTFASRFAVADAAVELGVPVVWGAVSGWHGQVTVFADEYRMRDLFDDRPGGVIDTCDGGAVLGTVCGQVGAAMATEAVKLAAGAGRSLAGTLALLDGRDGRWRHIALAPVPEDARAGA